MEASHRGPIGMRESQLAQHVPGVKSVPKRITDTGLNRPTRPKLDHSTHDEGGYEWISSRSVLALFNALLTLCFLSLLPSPPLSLLLSSLLSASHARESIAKAWGQGLENWAEKGATRGLTRCSQPRNKCRARKKVRATFHLAEKNPDNPSRDIIQRRIFGFSFLCRIFRFHFSFLFLLFPSAFNNTIDIIP